MTVQSIKEHSENTAVLCAESADSIKLGALAKLIGLLHDMGKYTERFKAYLYSRCNLNGDVIHKGEVIHSPTGAIFAFERWHKNDSYQKCTAQIISMVIFAHHSGFMDVLDMNESSPFHEALNRDKSKIFYNEAVNNYLNNVADAETLDSMFCKATAEFTAIVSGIKYKDKDSKFYIGLIAREMLSVLVDADRFDSACFEYNTSPFEPAENADWEAALESLEAYLEKIGSGKLASIRNEISTACKGTAEKKHKIYRLTVPTGGGKTFASLRFALNYAKINNMKRIFYIIPFNTTLDQNAKDMRGALNNTLRILEHHSNVVFDDNDSREFENYRLLTERWTDSDIILTSIVQFLNCIFRRENTNAKRMCRLADSVLIFDEIQALPKKCTVLFERVINFLVDFCSCTVVLCTATQPGLTFEHAPAEMFPAPSRLFDMFRRTEIINETDKAIDTQEAARKSVDLVKKHGAVLMIVNTKKRLKECIMK